MANGFKDSMEPGNHYSFECPVVQRDARYIACVFQIRKHRRGEEFAAHDCRCAMRGNKCPAVHMQKKEWREETRHFYDADTTRHRLPGDIIERIQNVCLLPMHARDLNVSEEQQKVLFGGAIKIPAHTESSSSAAIGSEPTKHRKPRASAASSRVEDDMLVGIATTKHDAAEVINQAIERSEG